MEARVLRAQLLMEQERYAQARAELAHALATAPDAPIPKAMLAFCHAHLGEQEAAIDLAKQAVHAGPDLAYCHQAVAFANVRADRLRAAETAAREAIRLDPADADGFSLLGMILMQLRRWAEALAAADRGLALDGEHEGCLNLRALALTQLGRREEAATTIRGALQKNPDNAFTHANQGLEALHGARHKEALEHFREALRLNPELEGAREGLVEALKAHYLAYRIMLNWFLWMSRLSSRAQWFVLLGGYFAYRALAGLTKAQPELKPYVMPFMIAYSLFALMTWLENPMFEALLRLSRFGRFALSAEQTAAANALIGLGGAGAAALGLGAWLDAPAGLLLGVVLLGMTIPTCTALRHGKAPGHRPLWLFAGALGAVGLLGLLICSLGGPMGSPAIAAFVVGLVLFPWIANYLALRRTDE